MATNKKKVNNHIRKPSPKNHSNNHENLKKIEKIIEKPTSIFKIISNRVDPGKELTFGQKAADKLAKWAGSWTFISFFFLFLGLWMATNVYMWIQRWDPYPFILLNLVLSCLAAIQAPVILMSQNRTSERDRLRTEYDYKVNRKAEREIQELRKQLNRIEEKMK